MGGSAAVADSKSGMNDFLHHMKDGGVEGIGFTHLRDFLNWLKQQKRVVIEMDGDVYVIRTL